MKGYRKECVFGPLFKLAEALLELLIPYVVMNLINVGIEKGDLPYIFSRTALLALMGFVGLGFSVTAQYFSAKAAVGFCARTREALFSHIQHLGFKEIDELGTSSLLTRLTSDMNQIQTGVNLTLRLFLRSPFIVFGSMIFAFTIDREAALTFAVAIPFLLILVFGIMLGTVPLYKKVQQKLDRVLLKTRENLLGVRPLRALCKEEEEIAEFDSENRALNRSQKLVGKISALMNPLTLVTVNGAIALLIYVGALKVQSGILTQGAVIALYNYMTQILVELIKLANLIINITKSVACANRVSAVLAVSPAMKEGEGAGSFRAEEKRDGSEALPPAVEFRDVGFKYAKGGENSLDGISFKAEKGETIGIIGGTGAGKTTLVHLIDRFYDATEGEIFIDGIPISSYRFGELRKKVGIVRQAAALFRGDIRSNLRFGNEEATEEEMLEALQAAQALSFVQKKPGGLDFVLEQGGKNLSGGQRQRLTVAMALVKKPEILILDDSSSALDYATDLALRRAIRALPYSPTVFLVSQRASSLVGADRILVLDEGKLVGSGKHGELLSSCTVYREIVESQSRAS